MFLEILNATYLADYKIRLFFNNGQNMIIDFSDELNGRIFEPLKEKSVFQVFTIKYNTIEWSNGADFAPEYLFELGKSQMEINQKYAV